MPITRVPRGIKAINDPLPRHRYRDRRPGAGGAVDAVSRHGRLCAGAGDRGDLHHQPRPAAGPRRPSGDGRLVADPAGGLGGGHIRSGGAGRGHDALGRLGAGAAGAADLRRPSAHLRRQMGGLVSAALCGGAAEPGAALGRGAVRADRAGPTEPDRRAARPGPGHPAREALPAGVARRRAAQPPGDRRRGRLCPSAAAGAGDAGGGRGRIGRHASGLGVTGSGDGRAGSRLSLSGRPGRR